MAGMRKCRVCWAKFPKKEARGGALVVFKGSICPRCERDRLKVVSTYLAKRAKDG